MLAQECGIIILIFQFHVILDMYPVEGRWGHGESNHFPTIQTWKFVEPNVLFLFKGLLVL